MYFHGHEILAPLTLTKHDSSLTLRGYHRTRSGKLEPTPELVLLEFHPPAPSPPPDPNAEPDSNWILIREAGAYGKWAEKGGASRYEAADSAAAFLRRSDRVKRVTRTVSGTGFFIEFANGEKFLKMGDEDPNHVPPTPAELIDGQFRDLSRSLDTGALVFVAQGRLDVPDGQRQYSDSLLRHPNPEMTRRLPEIDEFLDDSIPLDRFALTTRN